MLSITYRQTQSSHKRTHIKLAVPPCAGCIELAQASSAPTKMMPTITWEQGAERAEQRAESKQRKKIP